MAGGHSWSYCVCLQSYWYHSEYYKSLNMKTRNFLDYPYMSLPDIDEDRWSDLEDKLEKKIYDEVDKQEKASTMTPRQEIMLTRAKAHIVDMRNILDDVMYRSDPLDDKTFFKIREAYDLICKANDKL